MNLAVWLTRRALAAPEAAALFDGRDCVADYAGFAARAGRFAAFLVGKGVESGDRVALFMDNRPEYLVALFGCWIAGAAVVPVNAKLHPREVGWICENSGARVVVSAASKAEALLGAGLALDVVDLASDRIIQVLAEQDVLKEVVPKDPGDLAWLFYTSGTTGKPKGVIITHGMLAAMAMAYFVDVDQVSCQDAALYAAPLSHGAGLYSLMHVLKGARHVFPVSRGFDEREIFELATFHTRVHMFAAPTMVKRMTGAARELGYAGSGLRTIVYAGGPMYLADILEAREVFGDVFVQIYGQGECPMAITALSREDVSDRKHPQWRGRLASVGRAQALVEVRIVDDAGRAVSVGEAGEIIVRGAPVMPGYWRNEAASMEALRDGWLWTGDMGHMDGAGYVTLVDRSKDLIISGGTNIYPREVEEALLEHPDVQEVAVIGVAHEDWGEEVMAIYVSDVEIAPDILDRWCLERIARFKRPKHYRRAQALPKNNYGKVLKTRLREVYS